MKRANRTFPEADMVEDPKAEAEEEEEEELSYRTSAFGDARCFPAPD